MELDGLVPAEVATRPNGFSSMRCTSRVSSVPSSEVIVREDRSARPELELDRVERNGPHLRVAGEHLEHPVAALVLLEDLERARLRIDEPDVRGFVRRRTSSSARSRTSSTSSRPSAPLRLREARLSPLNARRHTLAQGATRRSGDGRVSPCFLGPGRRGHGSCCSVRP